MHLHFVQSLEPLQGAGLGQAALSLHLALSRLQSVSSTLLSTRSRSFTSRWPGVLQGTRKGPTKLFYAPELKVLVRESLGDVEWFHAHGLYVWTNYWLGGEARRRAKPLVYHPHGFFDPWILRRSKRLKRVAHWLFEDQNIAHVSWWRALSSKEAEQIRLVIGPKANIRIIPNGIDLDEVDHVADNTFNPAQHPWTNRRKPRRLLFLSRIHPKKGLDLLVSVWALLAKEFPDWELLITGPDEGGYQGTVERMIRAADASSSCWIQPAVTGTEKHALFRTADLFVLPSYSEGFPMAVLEAAAHGVPVVQTSECNFPELTAVGAAWQCQPEKADLERALRSALAADDLERRERGQAGRSLVMKNYSWQSVAKMLVEACQ
jgi:glycosyltransferase involved in cell wall biosynthesis